MLIDTNNNNVYNFPK